jgi:curli production assembly/transport component CsgE
VAERIAAIVSRAVSNPEASSSTPTRDLPTAQREPQPSAFASAVAGTIPEDAADGPGITGLVTDETRTKVGRDFYDAFYDRWKAPDKDFFYTVVVSEQPMPSLGTRVVVRLNQNVVFQARLQPRSEMIEQASRRAVALTQRRLQSNPTINVY